MPNGPGKKASLIGRTSLPALLPLILFFTAFAQAAEQPIFGPVTYDVKARYGKENRYQETIETAEGFYIIKLQSGELEFQRPDLLSFSVNGETLLKEKQYGYRYVACFVQLKRTNTFELTIKDFTPPPFKRPRLPVRNVVLTIMPATVKLTNVALGLHEWEDVKRYADSLLKIQSPESSTFASAAANLKNDPEARAEAMRKLATRKDPNAGDFILNRFLDYSESPGVRGEAAVAFGILGETAAIPTLMRGMLDPEEKVRMGSARALSLYKEEDTKELLVKMLARMDSTMKAGVARAIVGVGWRPVGALLELAGSPDPVVANPGVEMLIGATDRQTIDAMLAYLESPGSRDVRLIIAVLGESKDSRAPAALSKMASDPAQSRWLEAELGAALAAFGDQKSAELIVAMIKRMDPRYRAYHKLLESYKKLTGTEYKELRAPGGKGP